MAFCEKLRSGEGNPNLQNVPGKRKDRYINTRAKNRPYTHNGTIWVPDGRKHFDKDVDTQFFEDFEVGDMMTYRSTGGCRLLSVFSEQGFEKLTYDLKAGCGDDDGPNGGITPPGIDGNAYTYYFYGKESNSVLATAFDWYDPPADTRFTSYRQVFGTFSGVAFSTIPGPLPENLTTIDVVFGLGALPNVSRPILKPIEANDPDFTFLTSANSGYRFVEEIDGTLWERIGTSSLFANYSDTNVQTPIDDGLSDSTVIYSISKTYPEVPTIPSVFRHVQQTVLAGGQSDYAVREFYPTATFIYSTGMFTT